MIRQKLPAHRGQLLRDFARSAHGRSLRQFLPDCAPLQAEFPEYGGCFCAMSAILGEVVRAYLPAAPSAFGLALNSS